MHKASRIVYDTNITKIYAPRGQSPRHQHLPPHPAFTVLAQLMGKQAGRFFAENRFKGLGAIELYRLRQEAKSRREANGRGSQVSQANCHDYNTKSIIIIYG